MKTPQTILAATDLSASARHAVERAFRLAAFGGSDFHILHAPELIPDEGKLALAGVDEQVIGQYVTTDGATRIKRLLHDLTATAGLAPINYSARVLHGNPAQQIIAMEQEYDADLIVVGKRGLHIAEELLLDSVNKHVLAESPCDLLVICDPSS